MYKFLTFLLLSCSMPVLAESQFDRSLIKAELINENYEIIDSYEFNKMMQQITNEVAVTLPRKVDIDTELLSMVVTKPLIAQVYKLQGIETKEDLLKKIELEKFNQWVKNYACSAGLGPSQVFRVNGTQFSMKIINSNFLELYNYTFPLKACDE